MALKASFSMKVGMFAMTNQSPMNRLMSTCGTVSIGTMGWQPVNNNPQITRRIIFSFRLPLFMTSPSRTMQLK
jgi:ABC-type proline/glycine betaine transport system substrate-binding protein